MAIRVVRVLEYTFPTLKASEEHMARWEVSPLGGKFYANVAIRSTVIMPYDDGEPGGAVWFMAKCTDCNSPVGAPDMPFGDQSARDQWAVIHASTTGHIVEVFEQDEFKREVKRTTEKRERIHGPREGCSICNVADVGGNESQE